MNKKYHYFYRITNLINEKYYYGIHSTDNLDDGYMGSGTYLHNAYEKYGIENFNKEILKFFKSRKELVKYEEDIVNEFVITDKNSYNINLGGEKFNTLYTISVKDKNGNYFRCKNNDPKYLSGEYIPVSKDTIIVRNKTTKLLKRINREEFNLHKDIYESYLNGKIRVIDNKDNKEKYISIDEFYLNKDRYNQWSKNTVLVKDKNGNYFRCKNNDPRYISGELKQAFSGCHHTQEQKNKVKETYKKIKHQQGEKNSQYGTCWIYNTIESKKIKKEDLDNYIKNGWIKGRKMKFN